MDNHLSYKAKVTKKSFASMLQDDFGHIVSAYHGDGLTLYYLDKPGIVGVESMPGVEFVHVASWQNGWGWRFKYGDKYIVNHKSWYARYERVGKNTLVGGVINGQTSRFQCRSDAQFRLDGTIEINGGIDNCVGEVLPSKLPPEIFWHCDVGVTGEDMPSVLGGRCNRCGATVTLEDAEKCEPVDD